MFERLLKWLGDRMMDSMMRRMIDDNYTRSIFAMFPVIEKVGTRNLVENLMRTVDGEPVERPLGSPLVLSPWQEILFNPVHLFRLPVKDSEQIDTSVLIGPKAQRPLKLGIPVLVSGMSYGGALSLKAKVALARGASNLDTATNTGEAPLLKEEREAARFLIGQYSRSGLMQDDESLSQLDAIEIQLGQGAQAAAPITQPYRFIDRDMRREFNMNERQPGKVPTRLKGAETAEEVQALIGTLRENYGVPVGLKIAATHHIEKELAIACDAGIDFFVVDGSEAGTHAGPVMLQDDVGLPALPALVRTVKFLEKRGVRDRVSVIAAGGLVTPGHFLKAMALGADAVYTGTMAVICLLGKEMLKATPFEPPMQMPLYTGQFKEDLDVDTATKNLSNFLTSCVEEMRLTAYALGKTALREINKSDLCTVNREVALMAGIDWGYFAPEEQGMALGGPAGVPGLADELERILQKVQS